MTIVEALKNLYVAMGGEADNVEDFSLNPDMVNAIAELVSSGETKELPAVTAEDNDKVLAVVNGAWDKAEASGGGGGGGVFVVGMETDMQTGTVTLNKTWQEIYDAMASEMTAFIKAMVENETDHIVAFSPIVAAIGANSAYIVKVIAEDGTGGGTGVTMRMAVAASADSYPVLQSQEQGG